MKVKKLRITFSTSLFLLMTLVLSTNIKAQSPKSHVKEGNKLYEDSAFGEATLSYQKALEIDGGYGKAAYNLGNAFYRQQNIGEAVKYYEMAAADAIEKDEKAHAFHNIGTSFLNTARFLIKNPPAEGDTTEYPDPQQLLNASIESFKKALRNNPKDEESRYNLAYAQKLLNEEGGGGGGQDNQEQENEEQGEQEEEKKEGDEGEDGKENEKDGKGDQKEDKEKEGDQQKKDGEMSKQEAEQMLNALDKQEKDLQEKLAKEKQAGERIKIEKDW